MSLQASCWRCVRCVRQETGLNSPGIESEVYDLPCLIQLRWSRSRHRLQPSKGRARVCYTGALAFNDVTISDAMTTRRVVRRGVWYRLLWPMHWKFRELRPIHTKRVYVHRATAVDGRRRAWCEWDFKPRDFWDMPANRHYIYLKHRVNNIDCVHEILIHLKTLSTKLQEDNMSQHHQRRMEQCP